MTDESITLVDTHCHLDFERFDGERNRIIERALAAGVRRIIVPAIELGNCAAVLRLAERYDAVYAAVGVHPNSAVDWRSAWLGAIRDYAAHPKVVAIGEIGLDNHWDKTPAHVQHTAFAAQLELAAELRLPVIVHNREASDDVLRLLRASPVAGQEQPGVLHSFSADFTAAEKALEMGFYLGFTGPVTFERADELRAIAAHTPLGRLLIETDAPFLTPEPYRGRRNEPAYVRHVGQRIAEIRGLALGEVAEATTENAARLFGLSLTPEV
ncbi:MAG: TatD family hydrolase [Candidatus Promineifilaceae bacterium]|nr:TatD family hydrolase [Candidatus Promineifilaceae bacterium]